MVAGVALMPLLVEPDVRFHASFLRALEAFAAEGRGGAGDTSMIGRDLASGVVAGTTQRSSPTMSPRSAR